jgi:hypothetical protein
MYFQEVTPDTSGYMIAGYVIAFVIMGLYVASIYLRGRNLKQDMSTLEDLNQSASVPMPRQNPAKPANSQATQTVTKPTTKN